MTGTISKKGIDYANRVISGEILACSETIQACNRFINDLSSDKYYFDSKAAERACKAIQLFPHIKGKWAGSRLELEPWQIFIIINLFGWMDMQTGLRRFRTAYIEVPRKNAKSTLSSAIGLYMAFLDGEGGAEVYSAATTRDQAKIVFNDARAMARKSPQFLAAKGVQVLAHGIVQIDTMSKFEALSAEGNSLDGLNVHCGIIDELHAHKTRAVFDVIETATGARTQSLLLLITTAGSNRAGICYEQRTYLTKILSGVHEDDTYFGIVYTIDSKERRDITQSSETALKRLEILCNCNDVNVAKIKKSWLEECVKLVTTGGTQKTKKEQINASILIDQLKHLDCAQVVMSDFLKKEIQSIKNGNWKNLKNGLKKTEIEQDWLIKNGEKKTNTEYLIYNGSQNTELQEKNINDYQNNKMGNAQYAEQKTNLYAWIIATIQMLSEVYYVKSAILESACWEIMKKVYEMHSNTCKVKEQVKLLTDKIEVTIPADDWTDPSTWAKANPNYGVSIFPDDIARLCRKAQQMPSAQNNFLTKRLNVWVNADTAWMNMKSWEACKDESLDINDFEGEPYIEGLDLASKIDIAAKVKVFKRDDEYYIFGDYYLPEETIETAGNSQYSGWEIAGFLKATPGNVIDYEYIKNDIREDSSRFELLELPYDPFQATQMSVELSSEGVPMVEMRPTVLNFSEPMKQLEALVMSGKIHHNGDPVLTWMISNVVCHLDNKDNIYPKKERPENKIDGVIALIMALGRWMVRQDDSSVYSNRGIISL